MKNIKKVMILLCFLMFCASIMEVHSELDTSIYPYTNLQVNYARNSYENANEDNNYRYSFPKSTFLSDIYAYQGMRVVDIRKNSDSTTPYYIQTNSTAFQFQFQLNNYSVDIMKLYPYITYGGAGNFLACFTYLYLYFNETIHTYQLKLYFELDSSYHYFDLDNSTDTITITQQFGFNVTSGFTYTLLEKEHNIRKTIYNSEHTYDIGLYFRPAIVPQIVIEDTYSWFYESGYCSSMLRLFRIAYSYRQDITMPYIDSTIIEENDPFMDISEGTYWTYSSFSLESNANNTINMTNFIIDYPLLQVSDSENKFYYSTSTIQADAFGFWGVFDWLRKGII